MTQALRRSAAVNWSRLASIVALLILVSALLVPLLVAVSGPLVFDDAYMFFRYADNLSQGLGIVWNVDGAPTYGVTSHGWLLVVLAFSWLPLPSDSLLQLSSWLTGAVGLAAICRGVARRSRSASRLAIALAGAAMLALSPHFATHLTTGMDTMLAFSVNVILALLVVDYCSAPGPRRAQVLGLVGFLAFIVRPDSGVCALGAPLLAWALQGNGRQYRDLIGLLLTPGLLIAGFIGACYLYYGVPLPLGFFAKSAGTYEGFQGQESSAGYLLDALTAALPFLIFACLTRIRRAYLIVFFVPVTVTIAYLLSVNQVMGWSGRFYIPLLPYIVIPSLLSLDTFVADSRKPSLGSAVLACALTIACLAAIAGRDHIADLQLTARSSAPVPVPHMPIAATKPLPELDWFTSITRFSDDIARRAPAGTVIAASEVGYLGLSAPRIDILDLVGLNDTEIGMKGVDVDRLIERAPDLIWLPHSHYTGMRAGLLSSVRFHDHYKVISGAYNYGLAIRRDSPRRKVLEQLIRQAWPKVYPGERLEDHIAHPVS